MRAFVRGVRKAPMTGASVSQEEMVRVITKFEIASKRKDELQGLLRTAFNEVSNSEPSSYNRAIALASLKIIQCELSIRNGP